MDSTGRSVLTATRLRRSPEVVVEPRPRLVGDQLEVDVLAVGQAEQVPGPLAQVLGQRVDGRPQPVDRDGVGLPPGHQPLGQRARSRAAPRRGGGGRRSSTSSSTRVGRTP